MPKVTEAHRRARRDEIARAALRVLRRRGVASTSIAQIVTESGLSAGAIYANFGNKAELAQYVAGSLIDWKIEAILAAVGREPTPLELGRAALLSISSGDPPVEVLLQFWGEATVDPALHAVLDEGVGRLRVAFAAALSPWAAEADGEPPARDADRMAASLVTLCQGWMANSALLGWVSPEEYLADLTTAFGPSALGGSAR